MKRPKERLTTDRDIVRARSSPIALWCAPPASRTVAGWSLHRAFGNVEPLRDFLVREPLEDESQDRRSRSVSCGRLDIRVRSTERKAAKDTPSPGSVRRAATLRIGIAQFLHRMMFVHDAGNTGLNQLDRFLAADARGDHQNLAVESSPVRGVDELQRRVPRRDPRPAGPSLGPSSAATAPRRRRSIAQSLSGPGSFSSDRARPSRNMA